LRATLITVCFVLADDLHINTLKSVVGYGTVVHPACINIVFGCKQAQQYSRTHRLGFIRAVGWSAQNAESRWSHAVPWKGSPVLPGRGSTIRRVPTIYIVLVS